MIVQILIIIIKEISNIIIIMITVVITSVQTFRQPFAKHALVAGTAATAHKPDDEDDDDEFHDMIMMMRADDELSPPCKNGVEKPV